MSNVRTPCRGSHRWVATVDIGILLGLSLMRAMAPVWRDELKLLRRRQCLEEMRFVVESSDEED